MNINRRLIKNSRASVAMFALMLAFGSATGWATVTTFSTVGTNTWTCPAGVTSIEVECWGGGGGGGGVGAKDDAAGGGAGGSYVQVAALSVTPGTIYNLAVGAGGGGGLTTTTLSSDTGTNGGSSYFGNSVAGNGSDAAVLAVGGAGGAGNVTAGGASGNRQGGAAGGAASNAGNLPSSGATVNNVGTSGGTSLPLTGGASSASSGAGGAGAGSSGSSGGGAGGIALTSGGVGGNAGTAPGGGGSGGYEAGTANTAPGGAGGAGKVQLTYAGGETINTVFPGQTFTSGSGFSGSPTAQSAGAAFTVTLYAVQGDGVTVDTGYSGSKNITITGPAVGTFFPSTATAVTFTSGSGTISVTLNNATSTTFSSTDGTFVGNTSSAVAVSAGTAAQLQVLMPGETAAPGTGTGKTGTPTARTAGQSFSVTVNAVDANWNLVNTVGHTVAISTTDANATPPANQPLVSGTKIFTVTFKTAGSWTVTATDTSVTSTLNANTGSSASVSAGAAAQLQVLMPGETAVPGTGAGKTGTPAAQAPGTAFNVTINAVDANWNPVTSTHTVAITSSDGAANLPANAALSSGTKSFSVTFNTPGSQTVTVTDQNASPLTANTGSPTTVTQAGTSVSVTSSENPSGFKDSVHFTATLPPAATGNVIFLTNSVAFDTEALSSGTATSLATTLLPRGTNTITAQYAGDANYFGSTNNLATLGGQVVTNHPPVAQNFSLGAVVGTSVTVAIVGKYATDIDGDALMVTAAVGCTNGTMSTDGTNVTYSATNGVADGFSYTVSDGSLTATGQVQVSITSASSAYTQNYTTPPVVGIGGSITLSLASIPNSTNVVQRTTSMTPPIVWTPISTNVAGANGLWQFTDPSPPSPAYYRTERP